MSRRKLGRKITDFYQATNKSMKDHLKSIHYLCTTADIWSTKYRSFLGVTVHWVGIAFGCLKSLNNFFFTQIDVKTLERRSGVLACTRFTGTHSYDKIAQLLHNILQNFALDHSKIMSTVTDNGSNFVKAFNEFGHDVNEMLDSTEDGKSINNFFPYSNNNYFLYKW